MMTISKRLHYSGVRIVNRPDPDNVGRLNHACLPMIMEMERNGIRINKDKLEVIKRRLVNEMESLNSKVNELTGEHDVNLASPTQVSRLVFDVMKLSQPGREKKTKSRTRLSADAD